MHCGPRLLPYRIVGHGHSVATETILEVVRRHEPPILARASIIDCVAERLAVLVLDHTGGVHRVVAAGVGRVIPKRARIVVGDDPLAILDGVVDVLGALGLVVRRDTPVLKNMSVSEM